MGNFRKLTVWQLAKDLAVAIYNITRIGKFIKDFGLAGQMQRAAVSIPSNIAEGDELGSDKQSSHFFYIAKGSTAELQTQLIISEEIGYLDAEQAEKLIHDCDIISIMLRKLIQARKS
jgi:four helix bundle protein